MKQLVILSGKGGTGKTSVAAAFAHLAHDSSSPLRTVLADADVDAANLELVLQPSKLEEHEFFGGAVAFIENSSCQGCGNCELVCRFGAILPPGPENDGNYRVDPIACDGCAACFYQCPSEAIRMETQLAGCWFRSESRYGPLFHAELFPAQENSGKLVTLVKQQARLLGLDTSAELVIVDGPPGIGCPVISAASGADLALIVTEPTAAGIHDMERVLQLTRHFHLPALVCINKADLHLEGSLQIQNYCELYQIDIAGSIPFDPIVTQAIIQGEPVTAYAPDAIASLELNRIWQVIARRIYTAVEKV
jgi:MinD superfamily P-loop ATPase